MKNYKIYRVINDTHNSHGMVNSYAKLHGEADGEAADEYLWLKDTKTGVYFLCLKSDAEEATVEYLTKKLEQAALFFAGVISLVILGSNVINGGHWLATVAFAIIGLACFTIYKIQKNEY